MNKPTSIFRVHIAIPQDHGSWVFILTPLLIGLFAGGKYTVASLALTIAAMTAFLIRQPVTMATKAYSGRRSLNDLPSARFWMMVYGIIILLSIAELVALGESYILLLAIPAIPVFAWHLRLVSKRDERRQAFIEILAAAVLALAAPAAYWIGRGGYEPLGWLLWVLSWCQSAASIVYAYLRLNQRQWKIVPDLKERFKAGGFAISSTLFNLILTVILGSLKIIPPLIWLPYLLQAAETLWGTINPAIGVKPVAVGLRQLIVTILFTILFVLMWR
jgi:hypothetical protein